MKDGFYSEASDTPSVFTFATENEWSLEKPLPSEIIIAGRKYAVETSVTGIWRIIRMLTDETLSNAHKYALIKKWFYLDTAPTGGMKEVIDPMGWFIRAGKLQSNKKASNEEDINQDEGNVFDMNAYSRKAIPLFRRLYNIDLIKQAQTMHWWEYIFLIL